MARIKAHPIRLNLVRHSCIRTAITLLPLAVFACGCFGGKTHPAYSTATGGSAEWGRQWIVQYRCGQCHRIPGIPHARGVFGPPLTSMGWRSMIAGNFPNNPENMVRWIEAPTSMKPNTDMPDLGLSEQQARDVAAYLENLQ